MQIGPMRCSAPPRPWGDWLRVVPPPVTGAHLDADPVLCLMVFATAASCPKRRPPPGQETRTIQHTTMPDFFGERRYRPRRWRVRACALAQTLFMPGLLPAPITTRPQERNFACSGFIVKGRHFVFTSFHTTPLRKPKRFLCARAGTCLFGLCVRALRCPGWLGNPRGCGNEWFADRSRLARSWPSCAPRPFADIGFGVHKGKVTGLTRTSSRWMRVWLRRLRRVQCGCRVER